MYTIDRRDSANLQIYKLNESNLENILCLVHVKLNNVMLNCALSTH